MSHASASLTILHEQGPMTLRDLTRATSLRMGWSLMYDDVLAVMTVHLDASEVERRAATDYLDDVWSARGSVSADSTVGRETDR